MDKYSHCIEPLLKIKKRRKKIRKKKEKRRGNKEKKRKKRGCDNMRSEEC